MSAREVINLIKKRRSIRKYTDEPVSDEDIRIMLVAAMAAPSGSNIQPWEFVVVRDADLKQQLAETHQWSKMCSDAAVVFVVLGDPSTNHWIADTSAATQNLLLAAAGLDLGAVWIGLYPTPERETHVRAALGIPDHLHTLCLLPVGHPAESKAPRTQYDQSKVHYDRYKS